MPNKISDLQRAMLRSAALRKDRLLLPPPNLKGGSAKRVMEKLLAAGWVKEVKAVGEAPVWRRDSETGRSIGLKLAAAGVKATAAANSEADAAQAETSKTAVEDNTSVGPTKPSTRPRGRVETPAADNAQSLAIHAKDIAKSGAKATGQLPASIAAPRSGTKIDNVVKMLGRLEGATLEAIIKATGWLPHSTFAALTGLRKRGYALERSRDDRGGRSVYRLAPPSQTSA